MLIAVKNLTFEEVATKLERLAKKLTCQNALILLTKENSK